MADLSLLLEFYENLVKSRRFDELLWDAYVNGKPLGMTHLGMGEEAVGTGSMKVFPTLAGPSDAITIELNAAGGNTLRHLYISDAAGRIVDSRTVEAGKNSVSVDGGRFRSGMYNFTLEENGRIVDNGKIIVR